MSYLFLSDEQVVGTVKLHKVKNMVSLSNV